nr:hypothetical protein GCM10020241_28780 [Streptoalloteichus tenebrarius]
MSITPSEPLSRSALRSEGWTRSAPPVAQDQAGTVPADLEGVHAVDELLAAQLPEVEALQHRAGLLRVGAGDVVAQRPGQRLAQPEHASLAGAEGGVVARRHRERHHALGDALGVDHHGLGVAVAPAVLALALARVVVGVAHGAAAQARVER